MAQGGARNRSGPKADPNSARSEQRGYLLTSLPAEGYAGPAPDFPLPSPSDRELEVWESLWRTPQACAWSLASESWRTRVVALYTRTVVRCEEPDAPASLLAQLHRFADQIGMTTAGLAEMGWAVARDELGERAAGKSATARSSSRDRLGAVSGGG